MKELWKRMAESQEILDEVVRGGAGFVVNDDDIDMRKKNKKKVKTLELALKATKLVFRSLQVVVQTNSNDYNKKNSNQGLSSNGYVAVGL